MFFTKTNWLGENPYIFSSAFLALMAHWMARSKKMLFSLIIFKIISASIVLPHSHNPFDHGDSAAVVLISMLNFSQSSLIFDLTNTSPLLKRKLLGCRKILIHMSSRA